MPNISVVNTDGKKVGEMTLSDAVFGIKPNKSVLHDAVKNFLANSRQGTQSTLTRSEVSGGGRKPWRQKGTGNARQGSTRSPQWRHGGVALGPKPRSYYYTLNKKVRRLAMKSAFSAKVLEENMVVLENLDLQDIKTKEMAKILKNIGAENKALIVVPEKNEVIYKSARNIPGIKTSMVSTLNVYDILNADKFIVLKSAVEKIEEVYA